MGICPHLVIPAKEVVLVLPVLPIKPVLPVPSGDGEVAKVAVARVQVEVGDVPKAACRVSAIR